MQNPRSPTVIPKAPTFHGTLIVSLVQKRRNPILIVQAPYIGALRIAYTIVGFLIIALV